MRQPRAVRAGLVRRSLMESRQRLFGLGAQRVPMRGQDQRAAGVRRAASHCAPEGAAARARVAAGQALQGGLSRPSAACSSSGARSAPSSIAASARSHCSRAGARRLRSGALGSSTRPRPPCAWPARCARCSGRRAWRRPARRTPAAPSLTGPAPAFPPTAARHAPDGGPRRYAHAAASRRTVPAAPAASASPPGSSVSSTSTWREGRKQRASATQSPARSHSCRCRRD